MASYKTIDEEHKHAEGEYTNHFDPIGYYKDYCDKYNSGFVFVMAALHDAFSLDVKTGDSILDLATGPNIYSMISASKWYKDIVVSDFMEPNREFLRNWLRKDPSTKDYKFEHLFKAAAALEHEPDITKLEARVRNSVKEVIPCNYHLSNPIAPDLRTFDVVVSTFAMEAGSLTMESYRKSISNVTNLLNPDGRFLLAGVLKQTYCTVASHKYYSHSLTKKDINQVLRDAGLNPCWWLTKPFVNIPGCDCKALFFVKCIKTIK